MGSPPPANNNSIIRPSPCSLFWSAEIEFCLVRLLYWDGGVIPEDEIAIGIVRQFIYIPRTDVETPRNSVDMAAIIDFSTLHPMISVTIVVLAAYLLYYTLLYDSRRRHMPPLVRGIPLINQTFVHQREDFPLRLMAWKAQYGDIYRTRAGATDFIWLSSPQIVKELVDRRSQIYSSRQPQPMALGAASGGRRMTFMPKSKKWRTLRTITHKVCSLGLGVDGLVTYTANGVEICPYSDF